MVPDRKHPIDGATKVTLVIEPADGNPFPQGIAGAVEGVGQSLPAEGFSSVEAGADLIRAVVSDGVDRVELWVERVDDCWFVRQVRNGAVVGETTEVAVVSMEKGGGDAVGLAKNEAPTEGAAAAQHLVKSALQLFAEIGENKSPDAVQPVVPFTVALQGPQDLSVGSDSDAVGSTARSGTAKVARTITIGPALDAGQAWGNDEVTEWEFRLDPRSARVALPLGSSGADGRAVGTAIAARLLMSGGFLAVPTLDSIAKAPERDEHDRGSFAGPLPDRWTVGNDGPRGSGYASPSGHDVGGTGAEPPMEYSRDRDPANDGRADASVGDPGRGFPRTDRTAAAAAGGTVFAPPPILMGQGTPSFAAVTVQKEAPLVAGAAGLDSNDDARRESAGQDQSQRGDRDADQEPDHDPTEIV